MAVVRHSWMTTLPTPRFCALLPHSPRASRPGVVSASSVGPLQDGSSPATFRVRRLLCLCSSPDLNICPQAPKQKFKLSLELPQQSAGGSRAICRVRMAVFWGGQHFPCSLRGSAPSPDLGIPLYSFQANDPLQRMLPSEPPSAPYPPLG